MKSRSVRTFSRAHKKALSVAATRRWERERRSRKRHAKGAQHRNKDARRRRTVLSTSTSVALASAIQGIRRSLNRIEREVLRH